MSLLVSCHEITKSFGSKTLFESLSFGISEGAKLGIIGQNGAGKSTFLKILAGRMSADDGNISRKKLLKIAYLEQENQFSEDLTVYAEMDRFGSAMGLSADDLMVQVPTLLGRAGFLDLMPRLALYQVGGANVWRLRNRC